MGDENTGGRPPNSKGFPATGQREAPQFNGPIVLNVQDIQRWILSLNCYGTAAINDQISCARKNDKLCGRNPEILVYDTDCLSGQRTVEHNSVSSGPCCAGIHCQVD